MQEEADLHLNLSSLDNVGHYHFHDEDDKDEEEDDDDDEEKVDDDSEDFINTTQPLCLPQDLRL